MMIFSELPLSSKIWRAISRKRNEGTIFDRRDRGVRRIGKNGGNSLARDVSFLRSCNISRAMSALYVYFLSRAGWINRKTVLMAAFEPS